MFKDDLSAEFIREILSYDALTGLFTWRVSKGRRVRAGGRAGSLDDGYVVIRINGKKYRAHRLAWLWTHGHWPARLLDHRNREPSDNRLVNLRLATDSQNQANSSRQVNKTGFRGVKRTIDGTYAAYICVDRRRMYLGTFKTSGQAHDAYVRAARSSFGEFAAA